MSVTRYVSARTTNSNVGFTRVPGNARRALKLRLNPLSLHVLATAVQPSDIDPG